MGPIAEGGAGGGGSPRRQDCSGIEAKVRFLAFDENVRHGPTMPDRQHCAPHSIRGVSTGNPPLALGSPEQLRRSRSFVPLPPLTSES